MIKITVELEDEEAAALARLADKFGHSDGQPFLYPHVDKDVRSEQCYQMVHALTKVQKELADAGATSWPWIETGTVS